MGDREVVSLNDTSAPEFTIDEMDVLLYGEREALWFADELIWAEAVLSNYCVPCQGRGFFVVRYRSGPHLVEFPTCHVCGGAGRPRRRAA